MLYERLCCADFRPASIFCAVGNKLLKSHREYLNQSEALDGPSIKWNKEGAPSKQEEKGKGRYHGPMLHATAIWYTISGGGCLHTHIRWWLAATHPLEWCKLLNLP